MDENKVFPFDAVTVSNLPPTISAGGITTYLYYFSNTSTDQFYQVKVSFEIIYFPNYIPKPIEEIKLLFSKEYAVVDKHLHKDELRHLVYECIGDAYDHFKKKISELNYPYADASRIKLKSFEEEDLGFILEGY